MKGWVSRSTPGSPATGEAEHVRLARRPMLKQQIAIGPCQCRVQAVAQVARRAGDVRRGLPKGGLKRRRLPPADVRWRLR